jgi:molybdopterin/thiamine biosynthesis adenylyltransferase
MTEESEHFIRRITSAFETLGVSNLTKEPESLIWHFDVMQGAESYRFTLKPKRNSLAPLPYLYTDTQTPIWGWPHTGVNGSICAFDRQGLDYDPDDYELVLTELVKKSIEIVSKNKILSEEDRLTEFSDELGEYLMGAVGIPSTTLDGELSKSSGTVYAQVSNERKGVKRIERINSSEKIDKCTSEKMYVLEVRIHQLPPIFNKNPGTNWWHQLSDHLDQTQKQILEKKRCQGVILKVPNRFGETLILVYWGNGERGKEFDLYHLDSAYHEYLTQRTGEQSLDHKIAIIGVGSVGARVAEHLVLSGVKELTLVDCDVMSAANLGRHILSRHYIGFHKSTGVAIHLRDRMPGVRITGSEDSLQNWLIKNDPNDFDVLVFAIGSPAEEREMLRRAWKQNWRCRIVLTFVEAANLGGHAISFQPGHIGCLECLYDQQNGQLRTSMLDLKPGQFPTREISSCGSFTPYSAITATRTALLAAELALPDAALGYHRWSRDDSSAKKLELTPSSFWRMLVNGKVPSFIENSVFHQKDCLCCNS